MGKYAERTEVTPSQTLDEIERVLTRYGADQFMFGRDHNRAFVGFRMKQRQARFLLPMPDRKDRQFEKLEQYSHRRTGEFSPEKYEQAVRQRYRALLLVIKAKLESIESGIETFEDAFMAQLVLPSGETVGDWIKPQIEQAYLNGKMPPMLPMLGDGKSR